MSLKESSQHRTLAASAASAALAVAIVLFVQDLIGTASTTLIGFTPDDVASGYFGFVWLELLSYGLPVVLAFAGGVFLSLWLLAPASQSRTVAQTLLRGLLAAAVGAGAVLLVSFGIGMIGPMSGAGPLFGHAFPWPDLNDAGQMATMAFRAAIRAFAQHAPAVMLVVVLGWLWVQKHPSPHAVSVDVVQV